MEAPHITVQSVDRRGGDYVDNLVEVVDELRGANAIVFLFDPTRDMPTDANADGGTFTFFSNCLLELKKQTRDTLIEGRLPHALAVCVTKFDSVPVFSLACRGFWATQDDTSPHSPRVADRHAKAFVDWLCDTQLHDSAVLVRDTLASDFLEERTRYFVTSAAGFRRDRNGELMLDFPDNVRDLPSLPGEPAQRELLSIPRPVNVMEPILALYELVGGKRNRS